MSDFALQFVPEVDPANLTMRQRAQMAKAGTLNIPEATLARQNEIDDRALQDMGVQTQTGILDQGTSGLNEGLARFAGFPVDMATAGINAATSGINRVAGTEIPQIEDPFLGSAMNERLMARAGMTSQLEPQNTAQRYARRVGQEVGFGVPAAMTGAGLPNQMGQMARTNLPAYMAASSASDTAAAVAGQTAREVAPESDIADLLASVAGGTGAAAGIARANRSRPAAPARQDIENQTNALYEQTRGFELTDDASQNYLQRLQNRMEMEGADALSHPKAAAQLRRLEKMPRSDIYGVEQSRRKMRDNVANSPDEGHLGGELLAEIDDYLKSLSPQDVRGGDAEGAVNALQKARASAHTGVKYDETMDAIDRAQRSAATSGTGGNVLNRQSQEIGKFYDAQVARRPGRKKPSGYTPDEVAAMERIVYPNAKERSLRSLGRMSPTSNGMSMFLNSTLGAGGAASAIMGGGPVSGLALAPAVTGSVAQHLAERAKGKNLNELVDTILRGGKSVQKRSPEALRAAIVSQLLNSGGQ